MTESWESSARPLLEAASFAARAHRGQVRKDGETPYASHPFRVCLVVRDVFGIDDRQVLTAALLHDTVEDTTTDFDDIAARFGAEVARWVAALSKDKRLQEPEREQAYGAQLADAPWQVKVCKLADIFDNLLDTGKTKPDQQAKTFKNAHRYLDALQHQLPDQAKRPWHIVAELLAAVEAGETGRAGGS
jgi:guanosine-3',5'-bis(diphosphate) 3'-pyrophosphohydrolase